MLNFGIYLTSRSQKSAACPNNNPDKTVTFVFSMKTFWLKEKEKSYYSNKQFNSGNYRGKKKLEKGYRAIVQGFLSFLYS